jgi:hypothetical protein
MLSDLPSLKLPVPHLGQHIMIKNCDIGLELLLSCLLLFPLAIDGFVFSCHKEKYFIVLGNLSKPK